MSQAVAGIYISLWLMAVGWQLNNVWRAWRQYRWTWRWTRAR